MAKAPRKPGKTTAQTQPEEFGIQLRACQVVKFHLELPAESPFGRDLTYRILLDPSETENASAAAFVLTIDGLLTNEPPETPAATIFSIAILLVFTLSGIDSLERDGDDKPQIPEWANATILSVAIGTARGILMEKLASTIYSEMLLPIVAMKSVSSHLALGDMPRHGI